MYAMYAPTRRAILAATCAAGAWALGACERSREAPPADTTASGPSPPPPPPPDSAAPSTVGWDSVAGTALVVAGSSPRDVIVVFPEFSDSTLTDTSTFDLDRIRSMSVELFSRKGSIERAKLQTAAAARPAPECTAWPTARLSGPLPATPDSTAPWTVAFAAGRATPIPLDSIEDDTPADSAKLAADVTRLASTLPDGTKAFHAIPFAVRTAQRFSPAPGVSAVVAQLVRKVNQEANPREEHTFVIGERPAGQPTARYAPAYFERVSGLEETIETTDVLAAVRLGPAGTPTLVVGRDYGDGTAYSLVERTEPGKWQLRWSSAYAGC